MLKRELLLFLKKIHHPYSLYIDYCIHHYSEDIKVVGDIIKTRYIDYYNAYESVIKENNKMSPFNMFVMRWEDFDNYCNWLFSILIEAENRSLLVKYYNPIQQRIWGYISERLFNVWLNYNNKKLIYKPVIFFDDDAAKKQSPIRIVASRFRNDITMSLLKINSLF